MSYEILIIVAVVVNLGITLVGFYLAYCLYSKRQEIKTRILEELNIYIQAQAESIRQNPKAIVELLKPVIPELLAELAKNVNTDVSPGAALQDNATNPLGNLGISLLPKKYQILAQLILPFIMKQSPISPKKDKGDSNNPF